MLCCRGRSAAGAVVTTRHPASSGVFRSELRSSWTAVPGTWLPTATPMSCSTATSSSTARTGAGAGTATPTVGQGCKDFWYVSSGSVRGTTVPLKATAASRKAGPATCVVHGGRCATPPCGSAGAPLVAGGFGAYCRPAANSASEAAASLSVTRCRIAGRPGGATGRATPPVGGRRSWSRSLTVLTWRGLVGGVGTGFHGTHGDPGGGTPVGATGCRMT